jgi:hypothetical protein
MVLSGIMVRKFLQRYAIILKNRLADNCLTINILLIILGAFGAEDYQENVDSQCVTGQ